jgi:Tol biopolymer transport system component
MQSNGNSTFDIPSLSADGHHVAFQSFASDLFPDTNGTTDIAVHDLVSGQTIDGSVNSSGAQNTQASFTGVLSADGRYLCFASAGVFVTGDTNNKVDVFEKDLQTGAITRVSVGAGGAQGNDDSSGPAVSADGRYVAFVSFATNLVPGDTNAQADVFVRDTLSGTTTRVSVDSAGNQSSGGASNWCSISGDGRWIAFASYATNLVPNDTNGFADAFVHDRQTGATTRISVSSTGTQSNASFFGPIAISPDGRFCAWTSSASNLVPSDTNGNPDVFLRDRVAGTTEIVSLSASGQPSNGASYYAASISLDARYVAFISTATNLTPEGSNGHAQVFVRDRGLPPWFTTTCFGDGTVAPCPCNNSGLPGHGCQNSGSTGGALLTGSGVASLAEDSVHLTSAGEMNTSSSIFLQGDAVIAAIPFGNGLRCTGGHLKRPYTLAASGGVVSAPPSGQPSFSARSAALGDTIQPGSTRIYQVYYHDPNLTFCPNGFNVSNAIVVAWGS